MSLQSAAGGASRNGTIACYGAAKDHTVVEEQAFKAALCKLASGVSVLTTVDEAGRNVGLTMTALISASLNPPLVVACIDSRSRVVAPLRERQPFNIHILSAAQQEVAVTFAGAAEDKFEGIEHEFNAHGHPRIKGASAVLECLVDGVMVAGDHTIVVGRVADALVDGEARPLVYYQREFFQL